jgi:hypothetical protein
VYVDVSSPECRERHNMKMANRSFENVAQLKYLGIIITNQNLIREEVRED